MVSCTLCIIFFFFNDTATTEIYTLSLHDALPISSSGLNLKTFLAIWVRDRMGKVLIASTTTATMNRATADGQRSEEHTSELQSRLHLVCRLLLEKKKPA